MIKFLSVTVHNIAANGATHTLEIVMFHRLCKDKKKT